MVGGGVKKKVHTNNLSEDIFRSKSIAHDFEDQTGSVGI